MNSRDPFRLVARLALSLLWLASTGLPAYAREPALRALIVDGHNNHDWRSTTPVLEAILEDSGVFAVDVATAGEDVSQFHPDFARYNVVVSNYNGPLWPEATRAAFVAYMQKGGGLVSVHAADNSFPEWPEYNEMIGLGGWGGRDERSGPMVYLRDGAWARDESPGAGGSHGAQHPFLIVAREPVHPILKGLPTEWMHAQDELYDRLRGPAKSMTVLATAFADPAQGGTGRDEPMLFTVRYGEGRVFHTVLGHSAEAMRCAGFAVTLARGAEWAATGKVSQEGAPLVFPAREGVRQWLPQAAFASIRSYDFGGDRSSLAAIEEATRGAPSATLARVEASLLEALAAPETRFAGKQFVLRLLRQMGSERCVEPLARLLGDRELGHLARFALARLPAAAAGEALRSALARAEGDLRIGLVGALAERGDRGAVGDLAPLAASKDHALARAAIRALGRLGALETLEALGGAGLEATSALSVERDNALIAAADASLEGGDSAPALRVYGRLAEDSRQPSHVRLAAFRGILRARGGAGVAGLLAVAAASEPELRAGVIALLRSEPSPEITTALARSLGTTRGAQRIATIETLAARADPAALPAVLEAAQSDEPSVRAAAFSALGVLGDAASVPRLAMAAASAGSPETEAAFASLTRLRGKGVADALVALLARDDPGLRLRAIEAILARRDTSAVPGLLGAARDADSAVRVAAARAIGALGEDDALEGVIALLLSSRDAQERQRLGEALGAIAERLRDKERGAEMVTVALARASGPARRVLVLTLPAIGGARALAAVRAERSTGDAEAAGVALRALSAWRDGTPVEELLEVARSPGTGAGAAELQALALEGFIRMLSLPSDRTALATVGLLDQALTLAPGVKERRAALQQLSAFPCKEALALAERWSKDSNEDVAAAAKESAQSLRGALTAASLVATASHGNGETRNAFDGNPATRWTTGTPMRPGMWFAVDLGSEQTVTRIVLDSRDSPGDYPRGCEVYVSADGKSWGKPVLVEPPQRPITRLRLPKPTRGRFIKIVQTGETQGLFWSIHEMRIDLE